MSAETVPVHDQNDDVEEPEVTFESPIDTATQENLDVQPTERAPPKEEHVPLSALQKERRKRQEVEQELRWHKEQMMRQTPSSPPEPDESLQEPTTREELGKFRKEFKKEVKREVAEEEWVKENPEKVAEINDKLQEFLKQRPNLARAIEDAPNRYEEAWTLMDALTPKQKAALRPSPMQKKEAPGNPGAVPKAAAMNQSVDVMSMTDSEFNAWRNSQRKRR